MIRTGQHALISTVRDGKNVRRHFVSPLVNVHPNSRFGVDGKALIRVHGHAKQSWIGLKWELSSTFRSKYPMGAHHCLVPRILLRRYFKDIMDTCSVCLIELGGCYGKKNIEHSRRSILRCSEPWGCATPRRRSNRSNWTYLRNARTWADWPAGLGLSWGPFAHPCPLERWPCRLQRIRCFLPGSLLPSWTPNKTVSDHRAKERTEFTIENKFWKKFIEPLVFKELCVGINLMTAIAVHRFKAIVGAIICKFQKGNAFGSSWGDIIFKECLGNQCVVSSLEVTGDGNPILI